MASLSNAVNFLKSRDEAASSDRAPPLTPMGRLQAVIRDGRMIPFMEIAGMIGADPEMTATLVNQLLTSGEATVVTRSDREGNFLTSATSSRAR